jgi:MHS family proline/betaine transporter-like MFS transporter
MSGKINFKLIKNLLGGIFGNILEWYDFAVFGFLTPVLSQLFFPEENKIVGIILTFGVFATGYLFRPLGGIIFGYIGDNKGRITALRISILLMAIPTVIIGFMPTYQNIGIYAAIILVLLRIVQGLSVGGELIGSTSYLVEIAPENKKGFFGSFTLFSAIGGLLLGSSVVTLLNSFLTPEQMIQWGWRIPFIIGIFIFAIGVWLRHHMIESEEYLEYKNSVQSKTTLKDLLKTMPFEIIQLFGVICVATVMSYMLFVWMPTYLSKILNPPVKNALFITDLVMVVVLITIPFAGYLSDKYGTRKILMLTTAAIGILAYPLFLMTQQNSYTLVVLSQLLFALLAGFVQGPLPALMAAIFPIKYRYTGMAIGYNTATALIGGTTPMVATMLIHKTGSLNAPAFYLILSAAVSFAALLRLKKIS